MGPLLLGWGALGTYRATDLVLNAEASAACGWAGDVEVWEYGTEVCAGG